MGLCREILPRAASETLAWSTLTRRIEDDGGCVGLRLKSMHGIVDVSAACGTTQSEQRFKQPVLVRVCLEGRASVGTWR